MYIKFNVNNVILLGGIFDFKFEPINIEGFL